VRLWHSCPAPIGQSRGHLALPLHSGAAKITALRARVWVRPGGNSMTSLRAACRRIFWQWRERLRWRRVEKVSHTVAKEFGVPEDVMTRILRQTQADLHALAATDPDADASPALNKALDELTRYGFYDSVPLHDVLMLRWIHQLEEPHLTIFQLFKEGKRHGEIAALMSMDIASVRDSLVKTYADLSRKMGHIGRADASELDAQPMEETRETERHSAHV
jgi:hypothetical protein